MPITGIQDYAHVRLTGTDIDRSREFYDKVFGFNVAVELPADADDKTKQALWFLFGGVTYHVPGGLLGLRPAAEAGDTVNPDRIGVELSCPA